MSEIPTDVREAVIKECYQRAAKLDWEALSNRDRSRTYDTWLDDPTIGRRLTAFLSRERTRVWLKDGPMKEYSRAQAGVGPYSRFATVRVADPDTLAKQALGDQWCAHLDSVRVKPNRVRVTGPAGGTHLMIWGQPQTLRDLIWAGIVAIIDEITDPIIVVTCSRAQRLSATEKRRQVTLARQAGLELIHTTTIAHRRSGEIR
jgi:hypothetical protein